MDSKRTPGSGCCNPLAVFKARMKRRSISRAPGHSGECCTARRSTGAAWKCVTYKVSTTGGSLHHLSKHQV
jgi:hypothetical protein